MSEDIRRKEIMRWRVRPLLTGRYPHPVVPGTRAIFFHIPKAAGTSFCEALGVLHLGHHRAADIKAILGPQYKRFFKFAFVRHPWDRFLSNYYYSRMPESYFHSNTGGPCRYGRHIDYELLANASVLDCANLLISGKLKHSGGPLTHWDPQYLWIHDGADACLVDWLGRVENYEQDLKTLAGYLKIDIPIMHKNTSDRPKVEVWNDDYLAAYKIVRDYYRKDFALLGYEDVSPAGASKNDLNALAL